MKQQRKRVTLTLKWPVFNRAKGDGPDPIGGKRITQPRIERYKVKPGKGEGAERRGGGGSWAR